MTHLIDKSALVAEIERRIDEVNQIDKASYEVGLFDAYKNILSFLDILEVKEIGVDFGDPEGDIGVKWVQEEPASKDLEEAADKHLVEKGYLLTTKNGEHLAEVEAKGLFKAGAKWQKERMLNNATEREVKVDAGGYPYIDVTELYDYDKDTPLAKEGDKVKLVIIGEE